MDYFKQRRAYRKFKMYDENIFSGANNLYRELLDYANDENKLDVRFRMKNYALLNLTGLSESGLDKARKGLVKLGLIEYEKGLKNARMPAYKIVNLYDGSYVYPTACPTATDKSKAESVDKVSQNGGLTGGQKVEHKNLPVLDPNLTDTDKNNYVDDVQPNPPEVPDSKPDAPNVSDDPQMFYQNNFGMAAPYTIQEINEWRKDHADVWIIAAMKAALDQQVRTWSYVRGIMRRWQTSNLNTLEDVEADQQKYVRDHQQGVKQVSRENLPDWNTAPQDTSADDSATNIARLREQLAKQKKAVQEDG